MWIYVTFFIIICILVLVLTNNRESFMLRDVDELMFKKKDVCTNIYDYSSV